MLPYATVKRTTLFTALLVAAAITGLTFGSCSRVVDPEGYVQIESVDEPGSLPYEFHDILHMAIVNSRQEPTRGKIVFYDSSQSRTTAMCIIADSWDSSDSLSAFVFYGDLNRRTAVAHINIHTGRIDDALLVDYDEDGHTDLAAVFSNNDSLFLRFLNENNPLLSQRLLLVGKDRNGSGRWDGFGRLMGAFDLDQDGRSRELLISVDVGYDLYPRCLLCFDLDADSVIWTFPYAGTMNLEHFYVRSLRSDAPPSIVFGLGSKGNAARTDLMDDEHAYLVMLDNHGQLKWMREAGGTFQQALPLLLDYAADGTLDVLVPRRNSSESSKDDGGSVLLVYDIEGRLIDSLSLGESGYVSGALTADLFGDRTDEAVLSMSDGRVIVLNSNLQQVRKSKFYSPVSLYGIDDYINGGGLELAVTTEDKKLWILNSNLWPVAMLNTNGNFRLPPRHLARSPGDDRQILFVSVDGNRWFYTYTLTKTAWTRIFSRHPSLAFWLAFLPMALVVLVTIGLWRRTRRQYRTIARQKEHLDQILHDLREARKELVEAEEFRKTREALLASEQRFRELSELLPQTVFECDLEGRFTYVNRRGLEATGYSLTDIVDGLYIHDVIETIDNRTIEDILRERINGTAPDSIEYLIIRKDGKKFPAMSYSTAIYHNGEPVGIRGISIDMTERKATEQALIESEERYRNLVESAGDPIFTVNRDGRFLFMNSIAAARLGGSPETFIGRTMNEIFPAEAAERQMQSVRQVFDSGEGDTFESVTYLKGKQAYYRTSLGPVLDATGKVVAVLGIGRDVSPMVTMTQALKSERDFIRSLLDTAYSTIVCFDENLCITEFNHECERLLGISRSAAIGQHWTDLPYSNECGTSREDFVAWIVDGQSHRYEGALCTAENVQLTMLWSKSKLAMAGSDDRWITIAIGQDITDLKQVEAAMASSEERYRRIWEASGQAISLTDENGILRFVNPAYCKLFNYSEEELLGRYFGDLVLPEESLAYMTKRYPDIFRSKEPYSVDDYALRDKYGEPLWADISVAHIILQDDAHFVVTMLTDITSRRKAQQALRESEEKFRTIAEAIAVAIVISRPTDGKIYYINHSCCEMFGYTEEEMYALKSPALYDQPEDRLLVIEKLQSGQNVYNIEVVARRKDGSRFWSLLTVLPLTIDGRPALLGSLVDISERKEIEEALRESEERFRTIAEATPIPVAISRFSDGEIIYANPSLGPTFGYDADEMVGRKSTTLYDNPGDREHIAEMLKRNGRVNNYELVGVRKDGSKFWALMTLQTIRFRGELAIFGAFIDVTERKQTRLRLEQAAQEQYDQIKRVAGSLAHEIYNALFPATSLLDKLRDRLDLHELNELGRNRRLLDLSEQAVHRAIDMTGLVKQYSRLEAERKYEPVSLHQVMGEVIQANAGDIDDADITVRNELPEDVQIRMYRMHAYSLLNNLTTNAISALRGQPERIITVALLSRTSKELKVVFQDTGPGVPAVVRDSIFKAFFSTNPSSGTGLGLAMVQRIAELYGGSVTLLDDVDKGAHFVILLPLNGDN